MPVSGDGGQTWEARAAAGGTPAAVVARAGGSGEPEVVVVTDAVMTSLDGGTTFEPGTVAAR